MISVFSYTDYRAFLKDFYEARKKDDPHFSHRFIASHVGFDSGYFTKILQGKRNISNALIARFAEFLKLKAREAEYFEALVLFNQAAGHSEKKRYLERLMSFGATDAAKLRRHQYELFDKWYYLAVREILAFYPFSGDYAKLASLTDPQIRPKEAKKAIAALERAGLIRKCASGVFERVEPVWTTGTDTQSVALVNLHRAMADLGKDAFDRFGRKNRSMSTLTLSISAREYDLLVEELEALRRKMLGLARACEKPDRVYQCNLNVFPLSKLPDAKEKS
jgi:uncharacterized protein (TIGR02147 family)